MLKKQCLVVSALPELTRGLIEASLSGETRRVRTGGPQSLIRPTIVDLGVILPA